MKETKANMTAGSADVLYSQLSPCGHPVIADTPLLRAAAIFSANYGIYGRFIRFQTNIFFLFYSRHLLFVIFVHRNDDKQKNILCH